MFSLSVRLVLLWMTVLSASASAPSADRSDLLLTHAFWHWFPPDVRSVTLDRHGRAWFLLDGIIVNRELKQQVERAVGLRAPYVTGRIALFDSADACSSSQRHRSVSLKLSDHPVVVEMIGVCS
ncbi:MAG TPA: hypothetical protein VK797_01965 [Tepidisphaeraceae bacterium]|jgi:hypothetical protein|nr:hypothetical protein [Tepidisphaeraceae bacterium]